MNNTLGKHVLIDFYNCKASFSEAEDLQPLVERAFDLVGAPVEGITFFHIDDELTCIAVSGNAHICIHAYPPLSYVAVDIYSFNIDLKTSQIMSTLKVNLRSDRIKATSILEYFGSRTQFAHYSMRPKRKSKITTARRMKNTGARIKKTSVKMFNILRHPQKVRRAHRTTNK